MINKILILLIFPLFFGCSKSSTTSEIVTEGAWYISTYLEGTTNYTSTLKDYEFVFTKQNILNITKNKVVVYESWFANTNLDGTKKFELVMQSPDLKKLEGAWTIMSISSGTLSLSLAANGTQPVKKLVFETI